MWTVPKYSRLLPRVLGCVSHSSLESFLRMDDARRLTCLTCSEGASERPILLGLRSSWQFHLGAVTRQPFLWRCTGVLCCPRRLMSLDRLHRSESAWCEGI